MAAEVAGRGQREQVRPELPRDAIEAGALIRGGIAKDSSKFYMDAAGGQASRRDGVSFAIVSKLPPVRFPRSPLWWLVALFLIAIAITQAETLQSAATMVGAVATALAGVTRLLNLVGLGERATPAGTTS